MEPIDSLAIAINELEEITPRHQTQEIFPSPKYIKNDRNHIHIIAREGRRLINQKDMDNPIIAGIETDKNQYYEIINRFLSDLEMYITSIDYASIRNKPSSIRTHWGQKVIPSKGLFHIARSKELASRYLNVELHHISAYEVFCIPFIIRLTIEVKIKPESVGWFSIMPINQLVEKLSRAVLGEAKVLSTN